MRTILDRHRGDIDSLRESCSIDIFPIVALECIHQIHIAENGFAFDNGEADIAVDGFDEVSIGVFVEGVENNQIRIHPGLDLADKGLPIAHLSSIARHHLGQLKITEMATENLSIPQVSRLQFVQIRFRATGPPIR